MFGIFIFAAFIQLAIPIVIIYLIVRYFINRHKKGHQRGISYQDVMTWTLLLTASFTGIAGLVSLPYAFIGDDVEANQLVVTYLISGMLLLLTGIALKRLTGKFLMVLGTVMLLIGVIPVFGSFGSSSAFVAVLVLFFLLIGIAVRMNRKAVRNG